MAPSEQPRPPGRRFSVVGPAILIGVGIVLLLNNLEVLPWSVWGSLWRFWPVILILIGVEIMLRRAGAARGASLAVGVVLVAFIVGLALAAPQAGWVRMEVGQTQSGSVEKDLASLQEARANIEFGAGRLELGSLPAASDKLMVVDYRAGTPGRVPKIDLEEEGERGVLRVTGEAGFRFSPGGEPDQWELRLSRRLPLDLTVRLGAAEGALDLADLKVRTLNLDVGASSLRVHFPREAGTTRAFVNAGAASLTLEIPSNVGARIVTDSGLASIDASSRFSRLGGVYTTQDYQMAANRLDLELKAGVSSVSIR